MYENDQQYFKKAKGNCSKTRSTHNEVRLLIVLNKQNVVIDIFLKKAHLYDKLINLFDIFVFEKHFIYIFFFKKRHNINLEYIYISYK